jgi:DNA processing protein
VKHTFSRTSAEKTLESFNGTILIASDPEFPEELKNFSSCPPMLFATGDIGLLKAKKIAIIGARNASINGRSIAFNFSRDLAEYFVIVSGLANGIDTSVHMGALETGRTIAVLPFSLNNVYPKENAKLFDQIVKNGLAISEVPPNRPPDAGMFHARNRIIATLVSGLIIIEASIKSGTMSTAKAALDAGTEVLVVPGSPTDPRSKGCNKLIKEGAPLVESYIDVLEHMEYKCVHKQHKIQLVNNTQTYSDISRQILMMLSADFPTDLETIANNLNVNIQDILCNISELEISGKILKYSSNEIILNL